MSILAKNDKGYGCTRTHEFTKGTRDADFRKVSGGKPGEVIYDQDKAFIHSENFWNVIFTKAFQAFCVV
jgi:hypothetical protein